MKKHRRRTVLKGLGGSSLAWVPAEQLWAARSKETPSLKFGLIADVQYVDAADEGSRHFRESLSKLRLAIDYFNTLDDLAFVAHLGDSIDRDFASIAKVMPLFDQLTCPFHQVLGNHDFEVESELVQKVPASLGLKQPFYTFSASGLRFIVLDGNADSLYAGEDPEASQRRLDALKKSGAVQAKPWNGGLGETQRAWLDQQLTKAEQAGEEVILFCHFPTYPENVHNLWDCQEVLTLLAKHRSSIRGWFNGHNHAGLNGESDGMHFLTLCGLVETPQTNAYCTVSVFDDRLEIDGFGREKDLVLRLDRSGEPSP